MATYTTYETMIPEIMQYCHGAPTILLLTHIRNAAIKFCEKSFVLKKNPSAFYLDEDKHTYTLKYEGDRYRATSIKEARLGEYPDDTALTVVSEHQMDNSLALWRTKEGSEPTACFLTDDINAIRFYPRPNADSDDELFLDTVVTMKRDQIEIDSFVYEKWEEVIQAGALATILVIPKAEWYNRREGAMFSKIWKKGVREARATTLKGVGEQAGQVQPQSYIIQGSGNTIKQDSFWGD